MSVQNRLKPENCNKSHCKTCVFHPKVEQRIHLSPERILEIQTYLSTFQSSHICHQTKLTCYGALKFQAGILFKMKIISDDKVETMIDAAKQILGL